MTITPRCRNAIPLSSYAAPSFGPRRGVVDALRAADGWIDIDPTNDQLPPRRHITIGWGRDDADIAPLRGVLIGPPASQEIEVAVDVVAQSDLPLLDAP